MAGDYSIWYVQLVIVILYCMYVYTFKSFSLLLYCIVGNVMYVVEEEHVCFLSVDTPWPVECQPENFWGTEGQYRSWGTERGSHELSARPLSY